MSVRFHLLIVTISLLLSHQVVARQIVSSVDHQSIGFDETIWLTVTTDLQKIDKIPDFSDLKTQFDILSTQQKRQYQIVNGRASSTKEWRLLLAPKEVGKLVIPSFQLADVYSEAIVIDVSPQSQTLPATIPKDIFLESFTGKQEVYVQQQILFTIRLLTRVSLRGTQQADFTINDAIVEPLSERQYNRRTNNQSYTVLEKVYAIFPQISGTVTIPSIKWQAEKASKPFNFSLNPFDRLRKTNRRVVRLNSQAHTVSVLPTPDSYRNKHWVPTTQLIIEEKWDENVLKTMIGEPINRIVTVRGEAVNGAQIPPLPLLESNNFKIYPSIPKIENEKSSSGLTGSRTESYSIVPIKAGSFSLPEITVHWWDTGDNKEKVSVLPGKTLFVIGAGPKENPQNVTEDISMHANNESTIASPESSDDRSNALTEPLHSMVWKASTFAFTLATLCFFVLWRSKQRKNTIITTESAILISEKRAFQQLSSALSAIDLPLIRQRLITWAQVYFNDISITRLSHVANNLPDAAKNTIKSLDQQLYGKNQYDQWQSKDLLVLIQQQRKMKTPTSSTPALKPLYP